MNTIPLNDDLNLRDFISAIVEFIKNYGPTDAQPKTTVAFLILMLNGPDAMIKIKKGVESKDGNVVMLQKLFSGNISYTAAQVKSFLNDIFTEEKEEILLTNLSVITENIRMCSHPEDLYNRLIEKVSHRFFSMEEIDALEKLAQGHEYEKLLLSLTLHGFRSLYNLPCFFAERMYEEGLTLDFDSPHRYMLMRISALNGNKAAAMEYGNYLTRSKMDKAEEAVSFFMLALPKPSAAWAIAYLIEIGWVTGSEQITAFRSAYRIEDKLSDCAYEDTREELDNLRYGGENPLLAENLVFVYKVYFCLAYQGFFKAYNSMAKLLGNGTIWFDEPGGKERAERLRTKYSRIAIGASNVPAISNEGNRLRIQRTEANQYDPASKEERYLRELLELASDMGLLHACFFLGNYLEFAASQSGNPPDMIDEIRNCYLKAKDLDVDGDGLKGRLWMRLANIEENAEEKRRYYEKAFAAKYWDAAYYLAKLEIEQYFSGGKDAQLHLFKAADLLRSNLHLLSPALREQAAELAQALDASVKGIDDK